jgi:hypothetical protein
MELASIQSPAAAFVAGLVTSLHCAGMCGPMACWLAPRRPEDDATTLAVTYQASRLLSYAAMGAVAGALGGVPLAWVDTQWLRGLPWLMVVFFVAVAFRLDRRVPKPAIAVRWALRLQAWGRGRSSLVAAGTLGLATPLLPCGPLYFVAAMSGFAGSAVGGLEFMLAFGLGTLPLLWIVQSQFGRLRARITPSTYARVQMGTALVAACVIAWRLRSTLGLPGPSLGEWVCH